ncbi:SusC/RagA family TonB-linked outer membrane protein [Pedobacter changchengzhani]|uniref:SusC/RagA family TonB-linked outer membrane protein n=1 Tax=Pedobacter changchengzhani TaxID=2529274 RepID=A0A4R5MKM1_9SPHI|nr:SusC/RagA family TonB-linked outer membrane protein [Pedobacter changchengzhani]TDG36220.1 SusC/RagA family TonB-linked outer membrane protein [Pedobacter changchengzhani]
MKHFYIAVLLVFGIQSLAFAQQQIIVTGTVIDKSDRLKSTLPDVSILEGTKVLGQTDRFGKFRVTASSTGKLTFKYVGYKSVTIPINNRTQITVSIEADNTTLKQVEVSSAGYRATSKTLSTGSSVVISGKELQGQPAGDVMSLLQGKVPGLNIQNNTGAPGFRGSVTIRGISNIGISGSGNSTYLSPTSPLYVIDGVPVDDNTNYSYGFQQAGPGTSPASQIPPEDIENVEVLKDAAATALYGSRGAYGVILITTKRGNSKVPVVRYNGAAFVSTVPQLRSVIGGRAESLFKINTILQNDSTQIHALGLINDTPFLADSLNAYWNNSTNWQSYFYRTTYNQNHNLNVSGGDVAFNYKVLLGAFDQKGIQTNTGYSRYNLNMNMIFNPSRKFRLTAQLNNSIQKQQTGSGNGLINGNVGGTGAQSSLLPPPSLFSAANGFLAQQVTENDGKVLNTFATVVADYEVLNNLKLSSTLNYTSITSTKDNFSPAVLNGDQSQFYTYNDKSTKLYNRTQLLYTYSIKEDGEDAHNFTAFAFTEVNANLFKADAILNQRGVNDQLRGPIVNINNYYTSLGGTIDYNDFRSVAFASQLSYNYKQKYIIDLNYRVDGTSSNGPNAGYKKNPAIALKWNFDKENFMQGFSKWLDYGDFRLSYGSNIQPNGTIYDAYGRYAGGPKYNGQTTVLQDLGILPNLDLQPTKATTLNAGFDISVLKNKFTIAFDTYYKQNDNIFQPKPLSETTSFASIASNEISNVNYGYEFLLTTRPLNTTSPFKWSLSANFAINREVLAALPDGLREKIYEDTSNPNLDQDTYFRLGTNSLSNYLFNTKGVYSTNGQVAVDPITGLPLRVGGKGLANYFRAGDPIYADIDGNYVIDDFDKVIAGNSQPQITGGINSLVTWKNWSLEVNASFTLQRDILNNALAQQFLNFNNPTSLGGLSPLSGYNVYSSPGQVATYGTPYDFLRARLINPFRYSQTLFQEDGSYFKLNSIKVYYNFNQKFTQKFGMNRVSINLTASNLGFITNYSGPNPENVTALGRDSSGGYPLSKEFALGLNVEF